MKGIDMLFYIGGTAVVGYMIKTGTTEIVANVLTNNQLFKSALSALLLVSIENFAFKRRLKLEIVLTKIAVYSVLATVLIAIYNNH